MDSKSIIRDRLRCQKREYFMNFMKLKYGGGSAFEGSLHDFIDILQSILQSIASHTP